MAIRGGAELVELTELCARERLVVVVVVVVDDVVEPGKLTRHAVSAVETPAAFAVTTTLWYPAGTPLTSTDARQSAVVVSYDREPLRPESTLNAALSAPTVRAAMVRFEPLMTWSVSGETIVMLGAAAATAGAASGATSVDDSISPARSSDLIAPRGRK